MKGKIKTTLKKWFSPKYRNEKKVAEVVDVSVSYFTTEQMQILDSTHKDVHSLRCLIFSWYENQSLKCPRNNIKILATEIISTWFRTGQTTSLPTIFEKMFYLRNNWQWFERLGLLISMVGSFVAIVISIK